jgi:hypothetical protein
MKKTFIIYFLLTLGLALSSQSVLIYTNKILASDIQASSVSKSSAYISPEEYSANKEESVSLAEQQGILEKKLEKEINLKEVNTTIVASNVASTNQAAKSTIALSRGGTGLNSTQAKAVDKPTEKKQTLHQTTYSSKVELLDWWKSGRTIFSVGTVAEVTDLYTGKTFKAKRTMGTNHADSEALTKKDTDIIKSIWSGFSWTRRPVTLIINGKKYAASMSAMPHAGLDSAPAYAVINNRSEGYGKGENLDVIKGNGMDGHFDIHFLNSTRHKDGQADRQHQAAVLKAAGK